MCGICGTFDPNGAQLSDLQRMTRAIAHRGPDDEGYFIDGPIGLGSRRLSIIDLDGGHQPLSNEDGAVQVVFNGEIYNYPALRRELQQQGHVFQTRSDTEVIVHLYEELGVGCVERLRGMFAFAIWDGRRQMLVLARDHLGQKPLFYCEDNGRFLFASEIKGILAARQTKSVIDYESVHHYLSLRFIPSPRTMLQNIQKLPPAHVLVWQHEQVTASRYWDLSFENKLGLSEGELTAELDELLGQTVAAHLISDVPVGAFLSGGMDSSMIAALMAEQQDSTLQTFAIGVAEQDFDELPYARIVADHLHSEHIAERVQSNIVQLLPEMIWHLDEPSDPIAACQYYAAALAAQHVKVVLGGDGGDELFAGFDRYLGLGYVEQYARIPDIVREQIVGPLMALMPENFSYKSASQKARWVQQLSLLPSQAERYAEATFFFRFNQAQKHALYGPWLRAEVGQLNSADVIVEQYNRAAAKDPIDRMLYADYMTRLPEHSLMLTDRMTMAHGLELRSPFLDHELVTFMATVPSDLKIRNRKLKFILRKLGAKYLPPQILAREKQGFMFPVAYWFRNDLYRFLQDYLLNSTFVKEGIFRPEYVQRLLEEHKQQRIDHHVRLWMLLNLAIWNELYIEQRDIETVKAGMRQYLNYD